jgi:hypothetical protein
VLCSSSRVLLATQDAFLIQCAIYIMDSSSMQGNKNRFDCSSHFQAIFSSFLISFLISFFKNGIQNGTRMKNDHF